MRAVVDTIAIAIAAEEAGAPRDGAAEDVAAATILAFTFSVVLVLGIRGLDAASVVRLVRLVREVAIGISGFREDGGGF